MTMSRSGSTLIAGVCAAWLASGADAIAAADDAAQAQICERMLDAMASGDPERATDIMMLEGQPGDVRVSREGTKRGGDAPHVHRRQAVVMDSGLALRAPRNDKKAESTLRLRTDNRPVFLDSGSRSLPLTRRNDS